MEQEVESGYHALRETVEKFLNHSGYAIINLTELFSGFMARNTFTNLNSFEENLIEEDDEEEDDI